MKWKNKVNIIPQAPKTQDTSLWIKCNDNMTSYQVVQVKEWELGIDKKRIEGGTRKVYDKEMPN